MRIEQRCWAAGKWEAAGGHGLNGDADLVLAFGAAAVLRNEQSFERLREQYPAARVIGCTSPAEIHGARTHENQLAVTAVHFEHTVLKSARIELGSTPDGYVAGQRLADTLWSDDLVHVLVLSDASGEVASHLTRGLAHALPDGVTVSGGISGPASGARDGLLFLDEPLASTGVAAIGFYGKRLKVTCGSGGTWELFGQERLVTRAQGNVLYELNGRRALDVYQEDLGRHAGEVAAIGVHFPLSLRTSDPTQGVLRTVVRADRQAGTLMLAGDVSDGAFARVMRATDDGLLRGAGLAADNCCPAGDAPQFALLVSGANRRVVLRQRAPEEVEAVRDVFGPGTVLAGFYGNGEIAPSEAGERPELQNQTMSVTGFSEN
jgi:hypothetical protein